MAQGTNGVEIPEELIEALMRNYPNDFPSRQAAIDYIIANDPRYSDPKNSSTGFQYHNDNIIPKDAEDELEKLKQEMADDADLLKTMRAHGVFQESDMKYDTEFYPMRRFDPYHMVEGTREIVFFTRPSLPLLGDNDNLRPEFEQTPYFYNLYRTGYIHVISDLCYGGGSMSDSCPFFHILTNRITSNIDIPDIAVDELETAQNMWGTKIIYPKTSMSSDENLDFTCEFEDTKYLEIYHTFKAWDLYRQGKWWGIFSPDEKYTLNKILYDQISVFKFVLANDGETILHYSKWTGCFPKTISRSSFSDIPREGPLKINVGFKLSGWYEDMEPNIISDFNKLIEVWAGTKSLFSKEHIYDIWSDDIGMVSQDNVHYPFIIQGAENKDGFKPFYLEWTRDG